MKGLVYPSCLLVLQLTEGVFGPWLPCIQLLFVYTPHFQIMTHICSLFKTSETSKNRLMW